MVQGNIKSMFCVRRLSIIGFDVSAPSLHVGERLGVRVGLRVGLVGMVLPIHVHRHVVPCRDEVVAVGREPVGPRRTRVLLRRLAGYSGLLDCWSYGFSGDQVLQHSLVFLQVFQQFLQIREYTLIILGKPLFQRLVSLGLSPGVQGVRFVVGHVIDEFVLLGPKGLAGIEGSISVFGIHFPDPQPEFVIAIGPPNGQ